MALPAWTPSEDVRTASVAMAARRSARRWFADAQEACAALLKARLVPPSSDALEPAHPKTRRSKAPRHRAVARDLSGLRLWIDLQSGGQEGAWLAADNDNFSDSNTAPAWSFRQTEADLDVRPSVDQLLAAAGPPACLWPARTVRPPNKGEHVVVDAGNLRFAGGNLLAWRKANDAPWINPAEIYGQFSKSTAGSAASNRAIRAAMGSRGVWPDESFQRQSAAPRTSCWPLKPAGRDWILLSPWRGHVKPSIDLGDAPVARCPSPVLPADARLSDAFLAFRVRPSGTAAETTALSPPTIEDEMVRAAEVAAANSLPDEDERVLAAAVRAGTMGEVGQVIGFAGKRAEREGKAALIQAAKNLLEIVLAA